MSHPNFLYYNILDDNMYYKLDTCNYITVPHYIISKYLSIILNISVTKIANDYSGSIIHVVGNTVRLLALYEN